MGVHGLTTYLRENRRVLSKTIQLSHSIEQGPIPIIVDAWSLIYAIHQRCSLPWVYGGEYHQFSTLVMDVVQAWIKVGFKVLFVFDGPYPEIKFSTIRSRAAKSIIEPSLLFFRTSTASRTSPHFLRETRIIPPLYFAATVHALETIQTSSGDLLEVHFADEECDPYAVELAGRLRGYVVATDSDFVILNAEGYQGYIPLEEMIWTAVTQSEEPEPVDDDDDGFQQVSNTKNRAKSTKATSSFGKGVLPPENLAELSLTCSVFTPTVLAKHLSVPVTLLPLLASLAGNDFANQDVTTRLNVHALFFERGISSVQRIERVAATIVSILAPSSKRRGKHQVGSVMDLIDRTVTSLTARVAHIVGPGQHDTIVDKVAEGALQYAIPKYERRHEADSGLWPSRICALHVPDICPLLPFFSRLIEAETVRDDGSDELLRRMDIRRQYLDAYRRGHLAPLLVNCLTTGTAWPRLFIENPDLETVAGLTRPIRQWCYAILDDASGLPGPPEEEEESQAQELQEDEDDVIDVVESESDDDCDSSDGNDLLAPLRGALQNLRQPEGSSTTDMQSTTSSSRPPPPPLIVTEYIRRGTRIAEEDVLVPDIADLLEQISDSQFDLRDAHIPLILQPRDVRLTVMLRLLDADFAGIRALPPQQLMAVLVLRWVLKTLHGRADGAYSKARDAERWTCQEARCFIASFAWDEETLVSQSATVEDNPPVIDRHLQLTAQVLHAFESIGHLAQALLIHEDVVSPVHAFSGRAFHSYLTASVECPAVQEELWSACVHDIEQTFGEQRKSKKKGKKGRSEQPQPPKMAHRATSGGLFGVLGDAGA